jgi:hypothetical protein
MVKYSPVEGLSNTLTMKTAVSPRSANIASFFEGVSVRLSSALSSALSSDEDVFMLAAADLIVLRRSG